jgi:hypothetical protein
VKYLSLSLALSLSIAASANCANGRRQGLFSNIYYGAQGNALHDCWQGSPAYKKLSDPAYFTSLTEKIRSASQLECIDTDFSHSKIMDGETLLLTISSSCSGTIHNGDRECNVKDIQE